jgi:hypothetical protein
MSARSGGLALEVVEVRFGLCTVGLDEGDGCLSLLDCFSSVDCGSFGAASMPEPRTAPTAPAGRRRTRACPLITGAQVIP